MNYKKFCEEMYLNWRASPYYFNDFASDFQIDHLPEPYYPIQNGNNPIYILNNNPGNILEFQEHSSLLKEFSDSTTYHDIAQWLMTKYNNDRTDIGTAAKTRISRMIKIAETLGYTGIENIETFPLHSKSFNKIKFLKKYSQNWITKEYTNHLKHYLTNKPTLIVSAINSKRSLTLEEASNNSWLIYQADIIGLNLNLASFYGITTKYNKITSGLISHNNKFLICTMGSNSIPKDASLIMTQLNKI